MITIIKNIIAFIISLIVFLYAINLMSKSLNNLASHKLQIILNNFTTNKYLAIFIGIALTALIQSSSATSVILISFLNSHLISLNQATWVILGANIGTTITGLIIAFNLGQSALFLCLIGLFLKIFKNKIRIFGQVLLSLGLIFLTMNCMSLALAPFQKHSYFINLLSTLNTPLLAVVTGTIFTALIQSSSASVGILQTVYYNGLISLPIAINVIYGQNIGTCITALIAAIYSCNNAKRLAAIHILINFIGTIIFIIIGNFVSFENIIESITTNHMLQIAYMHSLFNIINTLIILPFDNFLITFTYKIIPKEKEISF